MTSEIVDSSCDENSSLKAANQSPYICSGVRPPAT
eukprot:CAMPEP_0195109390 /NCGR_PEP_ID=MMETSP0448-20130528/89295_1 /TAXON_ID=66468 /ORGANISM="Heterocapsa triquestra, Strain CCMP 448" /LENGTH=34 /DNA_ID= /DNA_START= /DNA_END= /DNA_ORIENTATION=